MGALDLRLLVAPAERVKNGTPIKVPCPAPAHDDSTASCAVYADHLHCYGCGLHVPYPDAVGVLEPDYAPLSGRKLLEAVGARLRADRSARSAKADVTALVLTAFSAHRNLFREDYHDADAWDWYVARGLGLVEVARYGLGATEEWYTIPLTGRDGRLWGLKYRRRGATGPKYMSPAGQSGGLLVPALARGSAAVVLCEGELDALLLDAWGVPAVSVTTGARATLGNLLDQWRLAVVAYDADLPGQSAATKLVAYLGDRCRHVTWNVTWGKDFGELYATGHLRTVLARLREALGDQESQLLRRTTTVKGALNVF